MEVKDINKLLTERTLGEINKNKEFIHRALVQEAPVNTLSEDIFVGFFLPKFLGIDTSDEHWVTKWLSISGTPALPVDVVNPKGEVLYRVPPIIDTSKVNYYGDNIGLRDIFERWEMISNNIPQEGSRFLFTNMEENRERFIKEIAKSDSRKQWLNICIRYPELMGKELQAQVQESKKKEETQDIEDLFDFD